MTAGDRRHARLGERAAPAEAPGVRVILDARPLQDPDRAPITAIYLRELLAAYARHAIEGESFTILLEAGGDDPDLPEGLPIAGRRQLPKTRLLRSAALTIDPFFLRAAALGAGWRADETGAAGVVYHAAGGYMPLGLRHPLIVTLLDLAPWELPERYQQSPASRFGQRLRARVLRDAAAVIVASEATATDARRLLRVKRAALRVVQLAPRPEFRPVTDPAVIDAARQRLGLADDYVVYQGRYDARHDLPTLLRALAILRETTPTRLLLVGASPEDRASLARAARREGVDDLLAYTPLADEGQPTALIAGARAAVLPVLSDANALPALEALACATPVVASSVGALPEVIGRAGILVEPESAERLATAIGVLVRGEPAATAIRRAARTAALANRTWADVARETRAVYAEAVTSR